MVNVAIELRKAHLEIPIMIGGASTSQLYVALKIAPVYGGPVVWMKDASQNPVIASKLLNEDEKSDYGKKLNEKYRRLRSDYQQEQLKFIPLDEARRNKLDLFDE